MHFDNIYRCLVLIICLFAINVHTQSKEIIDRNIIKGLVIDSKNNEPIPFATIYVHEINMELASDNDGRFHFSTTYGGVLNISVTYVGYQRLEYTLSTPYPSDITLKLKPSNYALQEVVVYAKEGIKGNSVSLIEKDAMQHIQPSSFADLLQLLPGHSSKEISMSTPEFISMRQSGSDINTSLGTSFIIDGIAMNNDGNLQNFIGLSTGTDAEARLTTSRGIDMRTIPTDMIESVEVVRGIPSVKYGDLTAGLVKIELKSGYTPWEGRIKTDFKNKLFSVGKGLVLPDKGGALNVDVDYASYKPDPRVGLTDYTRTTLSARYENSLRLNKNTNLSYKFNADYTGSFDKVKKDPDALSEDDYLKSNFNRFKLGARGALKFEKSIFKEINYNIAYSHTKEKIDQAKTMSPNGIIPLTTANMEEGIYETGYLPAEYLSQLIIDGNPVTLAAKLGSKLELKIGKSIHSVIYGVDFDYTKNRGKGEIYDAQLPPFNLTRSSRPRPFSDVPALKKLSFYIEDNINVNIGNTQLWVQAGVRATSMLGMADAYSMGGKYYWEPRANMKYTLPKFDIIGHQASFAITGGVGQFYKFPTLAQLYPNKLYFDYVQLAYYPNDYPDYRFANVKTYIEDPINYNLEPAKNVKIEAGFVLAIGNIKLDATFFKEKMKNGFSSASSYVFHDYKQYSAGSVQNPTSQPSINDFTYTDETVSTIYGRYANDASVDKTGIEYTLTLGKIDPIYTRIWINGAWFKTSYTYNNEYYYRKPGNSINDRPYPYIGVYDYSNNQNEKTQSQFNTNINFDTHIPMLRMIFSTSIETMWYEMRQSNYNIGMPVAYIDNDGNWYDFTPDMATDGILKHMLDNNNAFSFSKDRTAIASNVNLKLSKEIGDNIRLSCYFNNILSYLPDYTKVNGTKVSRSLSPRFGAELNIKF